MFVNHFRRLLVLCVSMGLLTAVFTLTAKATSPRQEDRPSRINITEIPHYPLADPPSVQPQNNVPYQGNALLVIPASKVAFQSYRKGNWDIYVGNDDGTGQTAVTSSSHPDIHPHLNRGNTSIAYASRVDDNDYEIYKMNVDGSGKIALTNNGTDDGNPQWSPNGTKILFESYRDGQAEIYVMNADGNNQVRLTNHAAFDGMPSWSPDGSKIVFSSNRSGDYRIWVMNADGSNPVQLSNQPYSFRPKWSPDGLKISYDADGDNDGWQELWTMNADGTGQDERYEAQLYTDVLNGSWSPNGLYLAFTRLHFVYYQGNWYWDHAYLDAVTRYGSTNTLRLSQRDVDWYPRWQTSDGQPPISQIQIPVSYSPAPIPVNWSGTDTGGSGGIIYYDVQVKTGPNGSWTNWLTETTDTSGQYSGIGGITYYFRVRAYDRHYNIESWPTSHDAATTIENWPPQSHINSLPLFSRYDNDLAITWDGYDPGNSGITTYDVQYRVNNGSWVNWRMQTIETAAFLPAGNSGETYTFRIRATDKADNMANWSTDNTSTTFYSWGISGIAYDNSHTPIVGITTTTNPPFIGQLPPDVDGAYGVYIKDDNSFYAVDWEKPGYSNLPETMFPAGPDAQVEVVLPPSDNVIANWGFEETINNWNISGNLTTTITDSVKHSGSQAAFLNQPNSSFAPPYKLSNSNGEVQNFKMVADSSGNIHVLWSEETNSQGSSHIQYAWRNLSGIWSNVETLSTNGGRIYELLIDENDTLHAAWSNGRVYVQKPQNGNWSTPEDISIPGNGSGIDLDIAVDQNGIVHAFIASDTSGTLYHDYFYRRRSANGVWSSPRLVTETYGPGSNVELLIDHHNNLHAIWRDSGSSGYSQVFYVQRSRNGQWSPVSNLSTTSRQHSGEPGMVIDSNDTVHIVWFEFENELTRYKQRFANGTWSETQTIFQDEYTWDFELAISADDQIHMVWPDVNQRIQYAQYIKGVDWTEPQPISQGHLGITMQILIDSNSYAHVVWGGREPYPANVDVYYTHQLENGIWSMPMNVSNSTGTGQYPSLVMDPGGYVHILWEDTGSGNGDVFYMGPQTVNSSDEAIISQAFTIPVTMTMPTLSFFYQSGGIYSTEGSHLSVAINDSETTELPVIATSHGKWIHYSTSLSDWIGETITLTLTLEQAAEVPAAWAIIDEVTVGSTYSDNWVNVNDSNAAPGHEVVQTVTYSNRGGAAANGVIITYTMPSEMTFISATIAPTSINPLVWHLPDLPAKSDPYEIVVTARVNESAPAFTTLTSTAVITSNDPELELLNNQAVGHIYTAIYLYLPAIMR